MKKYKIEVSMEVNNNIKPEAMDSLCKDIIENIIRPINNEKIRADWHQTFKVNVEGVPYFISSKDEKGALEKIHKSFDIIKGQVLEVDSDVY